MPICPRNCVHPDGCLALDICHQHVRVGEWAYSQHDEYPIGNRGLNWLRPVSPVGSRRPFDGFSYPTPDQVRFSILLSHVRNDLYEVPFFLQLLDLPWLGGYNHICTAFHLLCSSSPDDVYLPMRCV